MDGQDLFFQRAIDSLLSHYRGERPHPSDEELKNLNKDEKDLWCKISEALALTKGEKKD